MKKFKKDNLIEIINKQFEINWYLETYEDVKNDEKWLDKFETNEELEKEFILFLNSYLKPFCFNKKMLNKEVNHFLLKHWLKKIN